MAVTRLFFLTATNAGQRKHFPVTKKNDAADGYTCVGHARVTLAYSMVLAEGSKRHEWHVSIDMCYYIEPFLFIFSFT